MKLIVHTADYGMTDSCTDGTLKAIRDGILNSVGFMANNTCSERAAKEILKYPHVSVGQEINLVSGFPITDPKKIPSLVNAEGRLLTSRERFKISMGETFDYEEVLLETENQVLRFKELFGYLPLSLFGHSYGTPNSNKARAEITAKYKLPIGPQQHPLLRNEIPRWYIEIPGQKEAYTWQHQIDTDVESWILEDKLQLLKRDYGLFSTHTGFVDEELMLMSTFTAIRYKEVHALTSPRVKQWIKDNNVQLINYKEFLDEIGYEYGV